ncbi:putative protein N(5)-glutamine methyltransferase [Streptomyces sp. NPDC006691]|uniref:putative protein N(5)-glutamine methyltransferase n=1 Tax=Streptomyces sp. NPDC006691 TaxID=3364757 RepID=UPI0036D03676
MTVEPITGPEVVSRLRAAGCVFAEDEAELILGTADGPDQVASMVERRASGLPLEHVLGWAEFHGLRVSVDPGVFVPRRRTEFLVHQALAAADASRPLAADGPRPLADGPRPLVVVDLCCGSGALGAALAAALPGTELYAADIEPAAVRCARRNVAPFGGRVYEGDLFDALPAELRGRIDILTANVPYVPSDEVGLLPAEAREHEPLVALDGGSDGLDIMRRVALAAPDWLAPGGILLTETSERQVPGALAAMAAGGLRSGLVTSEELYANVVTGVRG